MEEKLATGLGKGQISEFVQDDEVHPGQMLSKPALTSVAGLNLEAVDEVDDIIEAATGTGSDAGSRDGDGQMGLAGAHRADDILLRNIRSKLSFNIRIIRAPGSG